MSHYQKKKVDWRSLIVSTNLTGRGVGSCHHHQTPVQHGGSIAWHPSGSGGRSTANFIVTPGGRGRGRVAAHIARPAKGEATRDPHVVAGLVNLKLWIGGAEQQVSGIPMVPAGAPKTLGGGGE